MNGILKLVYDVYEMLLRMLEPKTTPDPTTFNDTVIVDAVPPCMLKDRVHD